MKGSGEGLGLRVRVKGSDSGELTISSTTAPVGACLSFAVVSFAEETGCPLTERIVSPT